VLPPHVVWLIEARSEDVFRKSYSGSRVPNGDRPTVNKDRGGEKVKAQETGQNVHRENENTALCLVKVRRIRTYYGRKR